MFPKGQQKKKDTVVVMIDGKGPQTIPTMEMAPEAQKFPKCRLLYVLLFILLVSLVLLAGYCAWLFFSYNTEVVTSEHMESPDSLAHSAVSTKAASTHGDVRISTSAPPNLNGDVISLFSQTAEDSDYSEDFMFVSSAESVYDSSEPYGSSDTSYSSSFAVNVDYEYSYSETALEDTTRKVDQYLLDNTKGISPFERIKLFLSNIVRSEATDRFGNPVEPSYEVMSSYWFKRESENDSGNDDDDSSWGDVFDSLDWSTYGEEGSGNWESLSFSDTTGDLIFDLFSDSSYGDDGSGSGDGQWADDYDQWRPDRIPPPMTSPVIDQLPPERIEISVCSWPKKLLDQDASAVFDGSMKFAVKTRPGYDVLGLSMNNVSITQMVSEKDGSSTVKIFMRDYINSIVAVRYSVKTPTALASNCYFSFLTPDLEDDSITDNYRDEEMEGSGYFDETDLQELILEIRNPVLLGGILPMFNEPISDLCETSKKYWASSIHVKQ